MLYGLQTSPTDRVVLDSLRPEVHFLPAFWRALFIHGAAYGYVGRASCRAGHLCWNSAPDLLQQVSGWNVAKTGFGVMPLCLQLSSAPSASFLKQTNRQNTVLDFATSSQTLSIQVLFLGRQHLLELQPVLLFLEVLLPATSRRNCKPCRTKSRRRCSHYS